MEAFFIFAVIILVGVGIYVGFVLEKQRRDALSRFADSCGLSFSADDPFNLPGRLGHISTFNQGHSRRASNVLWGAYRDREFIAFDYKYTTGSGKNQHTYHLSACCHPLECRFPSLLIRHEGIFDKVADFLGFEDIDFESDEFSRKFRVKSDDRKFAYDVCHPQMMEWLLGHQGWKFEMLGGYFVLTTGSRWSVEQFLSALEFTSKFFEMIPEFVRREYAERAQTRADT